jgi:hypothetical protein
LGMVSPRLRTPKKPAAAAPERGVLCSGVVWFIVELRWCVMCWAGCDKVKVWCGRMWCDVWLVCNSCVM